MLIKNRQKYQNKHKKAKISFNHPYFDKKDIVKKVTNIKKKRKGMNSSLTDPDNYRLNSKPNSLPNSNNSNKKF
jgi:hypothetical protein